MKVWRVGDLVEHADGTIDIAYWTFDGDLSLEESIKTFQAELIELAKRNGTYTQEL